MTDVNWITGVLFPYVNVTIFLFLAIKFLKPPLVGALKGRKDDYLSMLKEANKAKDEALEKHQELQKKLDQLTAEVESIKTKAVEQGEKEAAKIISNAETLAAHLKVEAQRIADTELELARKKLQSEILSGVQQKVIERLKNEMGEDRQKSLFLSQVNSLDTIRGNA